MIWKTLTLWEDTVPAGTHRDDRERIRKPLLYPAELRNHVFRINDLVDYDTALGTPFPTHEPMELAQSIKTGLASAIARI